jgi:hypothetical protein
MGGLSSNLQWANRAGRGAHDEDGYSRHLCCVDERWRVMGASLSVQRGYRGPTGCSEGRNPS